VARLGRAGRQRPRLVLVGQSSVRGAARRRSSGQPRRPAAEQGDGRRRSPAAACRAGPGAARSFPVSGTLPARPEWCRHRCAGAGRCAGVARRRPGVPSVGGRGLAEPLKPTAGRRPGARLGGAMPAGRTIASICALVSRFVELVAEVAGRRTQVLLGGVGVEQARQPMSPISRLILEGSSIQPNG
jgi:hypothetical protein